MNERMNDRKKEIKKVEFHPGREWSVHVIVEAGVYGTEAIGYDLYDSIMQYCARNLSHNQMKEVMAEMERQIDERGKGNVPPQWRKLLHELKYEKAGE